MTHRRPARDCGLCHNRRPESGDFRGFLNANPRSLASLSNIKQTLGRIIPHDMSRVYLNGDICRSDLLTEVDGIISCE